MSLPTTVFDLTPADCRVLQFARIKNQVYVRRGLVVSFAGIDPEASDAVTQKAHRLRDALKSAKLHATNSVLVIPKHSATVRSVFLPSVEPSEIASMARFEAEKIIPFNVERHIISNAVLRREQLTGSRVLMAAVDEPVIQEPLRLLAEAGIEPSVAMVSSLAVYDAWRRVTPHPPKGISVVLHVGPVYTDISVINDGLLVTTRSVLAGVNALLESIGKASGARRPLNVLDLLSLDAREPGLFTPGLDAPTSASLVLAEKATAAAAGTPGAGDAAGSATAVEAGKEAVAVGAGVGAGNSGAEPAIPAWRPFGDVPPGESELQFEGADDDGGGNPAIAEAMRVWSAKLLKEIRFTIDFAKREFETGPIEQFILCGDGALIQGLDQSLSVTFGVDAVPFSPLLDFQPEPKQAPIDERLYPMFSICVGGAIRDYWPEHLPINLLPPALIAKQETQTLKLGFALLGGMSLIAACMIYLLVSNYMNLQTDRMKLYQQYNKELSPIVKDLEEKQRKLKIIKQQQSDRASALFVLDAISAYPKLNPTDQGGRLVLVRFNYAAGEELTIEGDAKDYVDINEFANYLNELKIDGRKVFADLKPESHSWKQALSGRPSVLNFILKGTMNSASEDEGDK